jgi:hypothetical protein
MEIKLAGAKYKYVKSLMEVCFNHDEQESRLDLREYLLDHEFVIWEGKRFSPTDYYSCLVDSSIVPQRFLEEALDLKDTKEDCMSWLRIWSNFCDDYQDFIIGLPGNSNEFQDEEIQSRWQEMSQGDAFAELEGRVLAHNLLKEI